MLRKAQLYLALAVIGLSLSALSACGAGSGATKITSISITPTTATVPVNTTAEVWVPAGSANQVTQDGARFVRMQDGNAVFTVGSGRWHFSTRA